MEGRCAGSGSNRTSCEHRCLFLCTETRVPCRHRDSSGRVTRQPKSLLADPSWSKDYCAVGHSCFRSPVRISVLLITAKDHDVTGHKLVLLTRNHQLHPT